MEIRILGAHNTESLESRMSGILVDDALCLDAGSLTSSLTIEEQLQLSAVLLTHRHYDHIRDIPALGMNLYLGHRSIEVYALDEVLQILSSGFINGEVYPRFTHRPEEQPTIKLVEFRPEEWREIAGYRVLSVSMPHSVPAVGYHVCEAHGPAVFYSGDTGPGFARNLISRDIKPD
jgi:ribonuclease BN (tRNA processing enzyme)